MNIFRATVDVSPPGREYFFYTQCTCIKQAAGGSVVSLVRRPDISARICGTFETGENTEVRAHRASGEGEKSSFSF